MGYCIRLFNIVLLTYAVWIFAQYIYVSNIRIKIAGINIPKVAMDSWCFYVFLNNFL